jgi:hypothetical protein
VNSAQIAAASRFSLLSDKSQIGLAPNLPTPRRKVPEAREVADDGKTICGNKTAA